ncbi:DNA mismatch repair protein MutL, partial [Escherichia coli]|nr:DNA mismatch repair protein MutL [Escherichia coli]
NKPVKETPTLFSKPTIPEYVPSDEDAPREDDFILETMPSYEPESQAEQEEHTKERIPKMYPIGQMHATYI